jgi:hypothetical protein
MTVRQYKSELERQRAHAKREEARIKGNPNGTLEEKCLWLRLKNAKRKHPREAKHIRVDPAKVQHQPGEYPD